MNMLIKKRHQNGRRCLICLELMGLAEHTVLIARKWSPCGGSRVNTVTEWHHPEMANGEDSALLG